MNLAAPPYPILYRPVRGSDVPSLLCLSRTVGWMHRKEDWQLMLTLGAGFVAEGDKGVCGVAMAWHQGMRHATLGMVIVDPRLQRMGIGRKLAEHAIAWCGERVILLNATQAALPLCQSLGFQPRGQVMQHQGTSFNEKLYSLEHGRLRPVTKADLPALIALHSAASGLDRGSILPAILSSAQGVALDKEGCLQGFALFRRYGAGYAVSPVVAMDDMGARLLTSYWLDRHAGKFIRLDVAANPSFSAWLSEQGLTIASQMTTMSRGPVPSPPPGAQQYGLTSQSLH